MRIVGTFLFAFSFSLTVMAADHMADFGEAATFDERFSAEMARIGFEQRPAISRPSCNDDGGKTTCNMRVGSSMSVVIGTDGKRKARDFMLLKIGGSEGTEWINCITTFVALYEPDASPEAVRMALIALLSPLSGGKNEFSTVHDMPNSHLAVNAHPLMGIVFTIEPRIGAVDGAPADEEQLGQIIAAEMLTASCPRFRLDRNAAAAYTEKAGAKPTDFEEGGRYRDFRKVKMAEISAMTAALGRTKSPSELRKMNCDFAARYYGPEGSIMKGLLVAK